MEEISHDGRNIAVEEISRDSGSLPQQFWIAVEEEDFRKMLSESLTTMESIASSFDYNQQPNNALKVSAIHM